MSGWFAMKRGITKHPLFKGRPERFMIWGWLIDNACWQDTPHDIRGKTVIVRRGQVCASERRIAEECGVGRQVVRTFLDRLTTEGMINPDPTHGRTIVTLCNWEKYQASQPKANPSPNPRLTQDQPIKEQENKYPPTEGAPAPTLKQQIFERGKAIFGASAGGLINGWLKVHGEEDTFAAIIAAEGKADPKAYAIGALRKRANANPDAHAEAWGIYDIDDPRHPDNRRRARDGSGNPSASGHRGPRSAALSDDLPGVFAYPSQEARRLPVRELV